MDTKERKAENRQFKGHSHKISDGHTAITTGNIPDALGIDPKGEKGALLVRIHQLQVELITDARSFGTEDVTNLKDELINKELQDSLDTKRFDSYETGLRRLRDELRAAHLKRASKTSPVTGLLSFHCLSQFLAENSDETIQESVKMLSDKYNVSIAPGCDVKQMFIHHNNNIKRKRTFSSSDSGIPLTGPSSKRSKPGTRCETEEESDEELEETIEKMISSKEEGVSLEQNVKTTDPADREGRAKDKQAMKSTALSKKSDALSKKSAALSKKSAGLSKKSAALSKKVAALSKKTAVHSKKVAVLSKKATALSKKAAVSPKAPIAKQQSTQPAVDKNQSTHSAPGSDAAASNENSSYDDDTTATALKNPTVDEQEPVIDAVPDPKSPGHATKIDSTGPELSVITSGNAKATSPVATTPGSQDRSVQTAGMNTDSTTAALIPTTTASTRERPARDSGSDPDDSDDVPVLIVTNCILTIAT
jgi:myosin heavy subunit